MTDVKKPQPVQEQAVYHFGAPTSRLSVMKTDPAFHYHWINDYPGRVEYAQAGGYVFVEKGEVTLQPGVTPVDSEVGSKVSAVVGRNEDGTPLRAYLMKIPLERYEAGQRALQRQSDEWDKSIRRGRAGGGEDENFYTPKGTSISMTRD